MKQTILMLHGFRGTHHGLQLVADNLKGFELLIPDLPGFGEGPKLETYNLDAYVEWVREYVTANKKDGQLILVGHSFGSIIASAYAAKYPDSISKLILINPIGAPALEGPKKLLTNLAVFYYWVGKKLPARIAHRWLASNAVVMIMSVTMAKTKDKELRAYIHDQHRQYFSSFHNARSVAEGFGVSIRHNVRDYAQRINIPTLLIAGAEDDITPLEKQKELKKLFPDAQLNVIENVGHLTHYETPVAVAGLIQDFIRLA